jgi:hypothetical protein
MTKHGLSLQERFELYVSPEPNTGCHLWMGFGVWNGYGCFAVDSYPVRAHRLAYEFYRGPVPDGMHVLHTCDVRCCVNPDHLFLGTNADNVDDKVEKDRQSKNRICYQKITYEQALAIRKEKGTQEAIGLRYGIGRSQVRRIQVGESWSRPLKLKTIK